MRKAALLLFAFGLWAQEPPDPSLTPGATLKVTHSQVCSPGFSKTSRGEHPVSAKLRREIMLAYGLDPKAKGYVIDHLIAVELGGSNDPRNLLPQTIAEGHMKDRLENKLHKMVCAPKPSLTLTEAQRELAEDWVTSYRYYFLTR